MSTSVIKWLLLPLLLGVVSQSVQAAEVREIVRYDSTWKYHDAGMDLGTAWREPGFNDTAWASGPGALGFPANENLLGLATVQTPLNDVIGGTRIRTHYFRIKFQWTQSTQGVSLLSTNLVDDGAVFYLNGVEVGRGHWGQTPVRCRCRCALRFLWASRRLPITSEQLFS